MTAISTITGKRTDDLQKTKPMVIKHNQEPYPYITLT